ncbi:MAG: YdcF family protein [Bacteroidia bacterium]|nr:YdcF family protein [Bacteroidia bacterium]
MKYTLTICFLLIFFNCCTVINPIRKSPFTTFHANIHNLPFDAIIVPGVPYNGKKWGDIMRYRILWSKFLFEKGYTKNIIFSGAAVHSPYIESKIMAIYSEALGIPKTNIYTEEKAEHSTENIYYSYYLAKKNGFNNIALATDPYQTNNLRKYMIKYNFDIKILPIQYDSVVIMKISEPVIDFSSAMANESYKSLENRESFFKRLRGTMGKNIPYTEEDKQRKK